VNFDLNDLIYVIKDSVLIISSMIFNKKMKPPQLLEIVVAVFNCNLYCAIK